MNRIDDITIERYLDGSMSAAEAAEFRALMASDPGLSRRVAAEESMLRAIRSDRDSSQRDHALARSRVLASITQIAPATGVPSHKLPHHGRGARWQLYGTMLFLAAWIATDIIGVTMSNGDALRPAATSPSVTAGTSVDSSSSSQRVTSAREAGETAVTEPATATKQIDARGIERETRPQATATNSVARSTTRARESVAGTATVDDAAGAPRSTPTKTLPRKTDSTARGAVSVTR